MNPSLKRRTFLSASAASMATLAIGAAPAKPPGKKRPLVVATENGLTTVKNVMERIKAGADPLDAIIAGVDEVQADPNDPSIGYGGFPNIEGVVELDALVMHGPTQGVGAVAALRNIKNPADVARAVMLRSGNCLLVGDGALKFAKSLGFPETDLMTPEMRKYWEIAKRAYGFDKNAPKPTEQEMAALREAIATRSWLGAMNCLSLDTHADIAGLSMNPGGLFKLPGRVGDTPIPGAGLYLDNEVGACGSTGYGEFNLMNCSCYLIIESLRKGMHPKDACLTACRRVAQVTKRNPRFRDRDGKLNGSLTFHCLTRAGRFGGASLGGPARMAIHDGESARMVDLAVMPIK